MPAETTFRYSGHGGAASALQVSPLPLAGEVAVSAAGGGIEGR
ncbi:MAG: hypothetical protein ACI92S_004077, partial [Planctomycetaceae bacterium]